MKQNKSETDTTKKSGGAIGTNTAGVNKTGGVLNNTVSVTETEMAQRSSEHGSEVIVVVD